MIVRGLYEHSIAGEFTGSRKTTLIPRIQSCPSDPTIYVKADSRRFPVRIAFAVTVGKVQGQTLKSLAIYPPSPVSFQCVAFS
jgi:hypothetical protein